jgi:hypothetical protein
VNTIRLPAPARDQQLAWGSTDWAAHSCLADWSELEGQWLGVQERRSAREGARRALRKRFLAALLGAAMLALACTPSLWPTLLAVVRAVGPALGWVAEVLPHAALGLGLLVLAGVGLGLWRETDAATLPAPPQPGAPDGAG